MAKKLLFLLLPVSLLLATHATAQVANYIFGYYRSIAGDSITGYFEFENVGFNRVKFTPTLPANNPVTLSPKDAVRIAAEDGTLLLSQGLLFNGDTETIFIARVLQGDINLYRGLSEAQGDLFFLSSKGQPAILKINKRAPRTFLEGYFSGCTYGGDIPYNQASLTKALTKFRACRYPTGRAFEKHKGKRKRSISVGVKSGYLFGPTRVEGPLVGDYYMQGFGLGGIVRFGLSSHVSIEAGVNWLQKRMYRDAFELVYSVAEVPLAVHYRFNGWKKMFPGVSGGFALASAMRNIEIKEAPGSNQDALVSNGLGAAYFFLGAGLDLRLKPRSQLSLGLKVSRDIDVFSTGGFANGLRTHRFDLSIGYLFSLSKR